MKETDWIAATAAKWGRPGASIEPAADGLVSHGGARPGGARCHGRGDHRLAMTLATAGLAADGDTASEDVGAVEASYPAFWQGVTHLTGADSVRAGPAPSRPARGSVE